MDFRQKQNKLLRTKLIATVPQVQKPVVKRSAEIKRNKDTKRVAGSVQRILAKNTIIP